NAWGLTNHGAAVTDLVVERIRDGQGVHDDGDEPVRERKETVEVAGGEPREITIRSTRHGPLVSKLGEDYRRVLDASTGADTADPECGPAGGQDRRALDPGARRT